MTYIYVYQFLFEQFLCLFWQNFFFIQNNSEPQFQAIIHLHRSLNENPMKRCLFIEIGLISFSIVDFFLLQMKFYFFFSQILLNILYGKKQFFSPEAKLTKYIGNSDIVLPKYTHTHIIFGLCVKKNKLYKTKRNTHTLTKQKKSKTNTLINENCWTASIIKQQNYSFIAHMHFIRCKMFKLLISLSHRLGLNALNSTQITKQSQCIH